MPVDMIGNIHWSSEKALNKQLISIFAMLREGM